MPASSYCTKTSDFTLKQARSSRTVRSRGKNQSGYNPNSSLKIGVSVINKRGMLVMLYAPVRYSSCYTVAYTCYRQIKHHAVDFYATKV